MTPAPDTRRVFLNVPFDPPYEQVFIGLVAALVDLGKRPVTVLEIGDGATPRLDRLLAQIRSCAFSLHDLSRIELSGRRGTGVPRFNMPFELGLAVAIARPATRTTPEHSFALLEAQPYRLQKTLSDMNGFDPRIHHGTRDGAVRCTFEIFADTGPVHVRRARRLAAKLVRVSAQLKREHHAVDVFGRVVFNELLVAATHLREQER